MGCDWIFRFTPCAPHHNHPDYFHLTMGAHLLCLESITHHDFQFGLEDLSVFFHPWCKPRLFIRPILRKFDPRWIFLPQSHHLYGLMHLVLLWIKDIKPFATSLRLNPKFCIQTILETPWKSESWCITKIQLVLFTNAPSKYAIMCFIKNVMTISWNHHVTVCLGSSSSSFWRFQVCVNEVFSLGTFLQPFICAWLKVGQSKV
jgi:hypothetical protein